MVRRDSSKKDHIFLNRRAFLTSGASLSVTIGLGATAASYLQSSPLEDEEITLFAAALLRTMGFTSDDRIQIASYLAAVRAQEDYSEPAPIFCKGHYLTKLQACELLLAL